jgi:hypothetical protein
MYIRFEGDTVGITNQKSALVRWTLTRYFIASFSSAINDRAGITSTSNTSHEEMKQTALKRDEEQVQAIIRTHKLPYRENTVNKVSALFFTFVDSRHQRIM